MFSPPVAGAGGGALLLFPLGSSTPPGFRGVLTNLCDLAFGSLSPGPQCLLAQQWWSHKEQLGCMWRLGAWCGSGPMRWSPSFIGQKETAEFHEDRPLRCTCSWVMRLFHLCE